MTNRLSDRAAGLKPSATLAANDKAKALSAQGIDILNLTAGQPDFFTPDFIKQAGIQAIENNQTLYTPVDGIPELKQAIINKLQRDNQLSYHPNNIIVSCGVKQSLFNLTQAVLNPGDEAIVLAPYWVSYQAMAQLAGADTVVIEAGIEQAFKVTPAQLEAAITERTKLLFLNSPSNPSGAVYSLKELKAIGEVLEKHPNILIASDDIYEYIQWGEPAFCNVVNACPNLYDRTIVMNGVAKAHCMTGWRIGFAACHPELAGAMKKIQSQSTTCTTSIAQYAAVSAFNAAKEDFFLPMLAAYQERHDYIVPALNTVPGIQAISSQGTFYSFFDASGMIEQLGLEDDLALTDFLLEQAHVALVPGTAFGSPNYMRLSFAAGLDTLKQAIERIQNCV